ncbi:hypothetical protein PQX77_011133 [Marasmius sp. AFHP31]|nr:hypothetical protein PQX77_011133 [Marasmius sp. AFHP31]
MASPSPAVSAQGPMFIGFVFNLFLLGVITLQCYIYVTTFKRDKLYMKCYVGVLYLINVFQTVLLLLYLYRTLVVNFGDVRNLIQTDWVITTNPMLTGLIATKVQLFFVWRIKVLTQSKWLALFVLALSLTGLVGAVMSTALTVNSGVTFPELQNFQAVVLVWLIGQTLADVAITTILVAYLVSIFISRYYVYGK